MPAQLRPAQLRCPEGRARDAVDRHSIYYIVTAADMMACPHHDAVSTPGIRLAARRNPPAHSASSHGAEPIRCNRGSTRAVCPSCRGTGVLQGVSVTQRRSP